MDVEQLYEEMEQMENKDKSGFFVELTNLKGKVVYIVFYAGNTKSVHVVPLQQTVVIRKNRKYAKKESVTGKHREVPLLSEKLQLRSERHLPGNPISEVDRQTSSGTEGTGTSEKRKI